MTILWSLIFISNFNGTLTTLEILFGILKGCNHISFLTVFKSTFHHEVGHCFDLNSKSQLTYFLDSLKFKSKLPKLNIPMYYKSNLREFMASAFDAYMRNEEFLEECAEIFNECAKRKKQ